MIKLLIADDHKMFCDGIQSMLGSERHIHIVGVAHNGKEVLQILEKQDADIILMDINMDQMDGIEASELILQQYPNTHIIMLTMYKESEMISKLIQMGIHGYVLKNVGKAELLKAIDRVMKGKNYYDEEMVQKLVTDYNKAPDPAALLLTPREKDVLALICQGKTTGQIAEALFISKNTVESHRKNLLSKAGVSNSISLVNFAYKNKLVEQF